MTISKESGSNIVKIILLAAGTFMLSLAITLYIFSYFDSDSDITTDKNIEEAEQITDLEDTTQNKSQVDVSQSSATMLSPKIVTNSPGITVKKVMPDNSETKQAVAPLPELHNSDDYLLQELNNHTIEALLIPVDIIRNIVVFVDNFSRGELISRFSPFYKPAEPFTVIKQDDVILIDSASYHRYDKYAKVVNAIDIDNFINLYKQLTPLFDEAYQELGYTEGSFNETFILAIDHALETPVMRYDLAVNTKSVMYKYEDENIESLPATQKLLLRMGPDNLQIVKQKLQIIQSELQNL